MIIYEPPLKMNPEQVLTITDGEYVVRDKDGRKDVFIIRVRNYVNLHTKN